MSGGSNISDRELFKIRISLRKVDVVTPKKLQSDSSSPSGVPSPSEGPSLSSPTISPSLTKV